jgi:hypothetical protein
MTISFIKKKEILYKQNLVYANKHDFIQTVLGTLNSPHLEKSETVFFATQAQE